MFSLLINIRVLIEIETETPVVSEDTINVLDDVQVFDLNGQGVPISDLWKDRKAVVAFARHFG